MRRLKPRNTLTDCLSRRQMYSDVLTCLTRDPLAGNVSPALIGASGTIPLSIISTIPDIMQHYKDCSTSLGAAAQSCHD